MKIVSQISAVAILMAAVAAILPNGIVPADDLQSLTLFGSPPPKTHWLWFTVVGGRLRTAPILYIATSHFATSEAEILLVLSNEKFAIVEHFTESQWKKFTCNSSKSIRWYNVLVTQRQDDQKRSCILSQEAACGFFSDLVRSPKLDWTRSELRKLELFTGGDDCARDFKRAYQKK